MLAPKNLERYVSIPGIVKAPGGCDRSGIFTAGKLRTSVQYSSTVISKREHDNILPNISVEGAPCAIHEYPKTTTTVEQQQQQNATTTTAVVSSVCWASRRTSIYHAIYSSIYSCVHLVVRIYRFPTSLFYHTACGKTEYRLLKYGRLFAPGRSGARSGRGVVAVFPAPLHRKRPPTAFPSEHQVSIVEHAVVSLALRPLHFVVFVCAAWVREKLKHNGLMGVNQLLRPTNWPGAGGVTVIAAVSSGKSAVKASQQAGLFDIRVARARLPSR